MTRDPNVELLKRFALITGGAGGIGAATAESLAKLGYGVFVGYLTNQEGAENTVEKINREGGRGWAVKGDISDAAQTEAMIREVSEITISIDLVVHAASSPLNPVTFLDVDWERDVHHHVASSATGFLNIIQCARPLLGRGAKVIVVMTDALSENPPAQFGPYLAGKGALLGLVNAAQTDLANAGIEVLRVTPGMTKTGIWRNYGERALEFISSELPNKRMESPATVAASIVKLASS
jgi:NAD(P)-dependent dehydrogenase (short-subunit alcohol dehydrogenase family)